MFYEIASKFVRIVLNIFIFFRAYGKENIPKEGAFLLCSNHRSVMDPVLIAAGCRRRLTFMAKEELFENPVIGWFLRKLGAYSIKRGKGDVAAVMGTLKILRRGDATLIFPEGTRVNDGERKQINSGIIRLAIQAKVPIVPAFVSKRTVTYGKPIDYSQYEDSVRDFDEMQQLADSLMDNIYSLNGVKMLG